VTGGQRLYAIREGPFCSIVRGLVDFTLHASQLFQIAAAGLAASKVLVALDCILNLKQRGIVGIKVQPLFHPGQGCE
jgi:hypothetical protein